MYNVALVAGEFQQRREPCINFLQFSPVRNDPINSELHSMLVDADEFLRMYIREAVRRSEQSSPNETARQDICPSR